MHALVLIEAHGKISTWSGVLKLLEIDATIVATSGHMCRFPDSLFPLGIKIAKGQAIDSARANRPEIESRIRKALQALPENAEIFVATDDDPEGDVIALDVMRVIVDTDPMFIDRTLRIRTGAITRDSVKRAIDTARARSGDLDDILSRAVPGRARALTDRWMGATFSRMVSTGCGRVRAGILGASLFWNRSQEMTRGLPETGEITFQARSETSGLPFLAQVTFQGEIPSILAGVARRYRGKILPGTVRPLRSAGAAVAPRFGDIKPFNTGDALVYASRFHAVPPREAMQGLQSAYMKGRISYPRTDNRTISEQSALQIVQAARICNMREVEMSHASNHVHVENSETVTNHEAIYPTPKMTKEDIDRFRSLVREPLKPIDIEDREAVEDLMVCLVARRAFEAMRPNGLERGVFHPRPGSDLTEEEIEALTDLEWQRAQSPNVTWSKAQITDLRVWPMASVVIEGMMIEEMGRPSTLAAHATSIVSSGQLEIPSPGSLPRPSPEGMRVLKALPKGIWSPEACRLIEASLSTPAPGEDLGADITHRMRHRIDAWFKGMTPEVRSSLVDMLKSDGDGGTLAISRKTAMLLAADVAPESTGEPVEMDDMEMAL